MKIPQYVWKLRREKQTKMEEIDHLDDLPLLQDHLYTLHVLVRLPSSCVGRRGIYMQVDEEAVRRKEGRRSALYYYSAPPLLLVSFPRFCIHTTSSVQVFTRCRVGLWQVSDR